EKRSPEVPLAAAQETSDPAGDAASREEGSVRTVVEVTELKSDLGLPVATGVGILHFAPPTVPRALRSSDGGRVPRNQPLMRFGTRRCSSRSAFPTRGNHCDGR